MYLGNCSARILKVVPYLIIPKCPWNTFAKHFVVALATNFFISSCKLN